MFPKPTKGPKKSRRARQGKVDLDHLAKVRSLPCWVCWEYGMKQTTPTEAHHPIIGRLSQDRAPDVEAQPLCTHHHRGGDPDKIAIHRDPTAFVEAYGTEADGTAWAHRMIETVHMIQMHRFRFKIPGDDGRPMQFPPQGPFWITGHSDTHTTVVAYAGSLDVLTDPLHWPDAEDIDDQGLQEIKFTDRFRKPEWWGQ